MVQIQSVNRHAVRKYEDFQAAMQLVRAALDEAERYVKKIGSSRDGRFEGWQVPDRKEVRASLVKARKELDALHGNAKTYEKELMAKGWMV